MRSFFATMALLWASSDARANKGSCSDKGISGKKSISENRFDGRWYMIAQDKQFYQDVSCQNEDFVKNFNGSVTISRNSYSLEDGWTQKKLDVVRNSNNRGEYGLCDADEGCVRDKRPDFYVIATDYEEWAIEYVCIDIVPGQYYVDNVTIKSRTPVMDESTQAVVKLVIETDLDYDVDENLIFINHCAICPFNTVPETVAQ